MQKNLNIGNKKGSLILLYSIKDGDNAPEDIKIKNSHISDLNKTLGRKVFANNVLYVGSETLREVMQPIGFKGKHNHHGLTPENVYEALCSMRHSNNVTLSYDGRYVIVTSATIIGDINIAVIVTPKGTTKLEINKNVIRIITMYPYNKK